MLRLQQVEILNLSRFKSAFAGFHLHEKTVMPSAGYSKKQIRHARSHAFTFHGYNPDHVGLEPATETASIRDCEQQSRITTDSRCKGMEPLDNGDLFLMLGSINSSRFHFPSTICRTRSRLRLNIRPADALDMPISLTHHLILALRRAILRRYSSLSLFMARILTLNLFTCQMSNVLDRLKTQA